ADLMGNAADVARSHVRFDFGAGASPASTGDLASGQAAEVWLSVASAPDCPNADAPGCAPLTVRERIVERCIAEIGKVENTPDGSPTRSKRGWRELVKYHEGTWGPSLTASWASELQRVDGNVKYPVGTKGEPVYAGWSPYFATWCARPEVR